MKDVSIIAVFPEERYQQLGGTLQLMGRGEGHNLATAVKRAIESIMKQPPIQHKSPNYVHLFIAVGGMPHLPLDESGRLIDSPRRLR